MVPFFGPPCMYNSISRWRAADHLWLTSERERERQTRLNWSAGRASGLSRSAAGHTRWSVAVVTLVSAVELWRSANPTPAPCHAANCPTFGPADTSSRQSDISCCSPVSAPPLPAPEEGKSHGGSGTLSVSGGQLALPGAISSIVAGRDASQSGLTSPGAVSHRSCITDAEDVADRSCGWSRLSYQTPNL